MEKRMISTELVEEDVKIENNLRPLSLEEYRAGKSQAEFKGLYRSRKGTWRFVRPCAVLRSAGTG